MLTDEDRDIQMVGRGLRVYPEKSERVSCSAQATGSVSLLTNDDVNAIQDEARRTFRKHQASIRGQMMTMHDMPDYHLIVATIKFMEQNDRSELRLKEENDRTTR